MGVFSLNAITNRGRNLLADVQAGAVFIPTRIVMGSGNIPVGSTPAQMTDVVSSVIELSVSKQKKTADGKVIFGGVYSNETISKEFYFRELALYARAEYRDASGNVISSVPECLYSYGNSADTADLMPAYSSSTVVERNIDLVTWVGNDTQIELTVASGLYVPQDEFADHSSRHAIGGADQLFPSDIGAASANHSHSPDEIGAAHAAHSHTPAEIGAAEADHNHDDRYYTKNEMEIKLVNAQPWTKSTEDLVAGVDTLASGRVYFVYE